MAGYVELHCHSAYSFLDGASQPEELAARAAELGYEALALTDHDGVYGSLEFAHAAKAFGVRPITGAEVTLDGRRARHAPRRERARVREPLPAPHRRARGDAATRDARTVSRCRRPCPLETVAELNEGLVCLSGCARRGLGLRDPNAAARLAAAFGRERFFVELQRPFERGDARRNAPPPRPRRAPRRRDGRDRRRPRPPSAAHAAPGRARRDPLPHLARRLRARAARQPRERPAPARGDARALLRSTALRRSGARASPSGSSST